jgi:hypothetical protein
MSLPQPGRPRVYRRRPGVLVQRALALSEYPDIGTALRAPGFAMPQAGATVAIVARRGARYELNLIAAFIWERMDGCHGLEDLTHDLVQHFDVNPVIAQADAAQLLAQFEALALIEPA